MFVVPRSRIVLYILLAALVISGAAFIVFYFQGGFNSGRQLEIRDTASGKLYGKWPLEENGEFAVEFIHSVHQSPVRESFKIDNRMILPIAVSFSSFGAGMLSDPEEGLTLSRDGDSLLISGFSTAFRELNYIVVSDHLLLINGDTVSLRELCGRNAHISIRIR